MCIKLLTYWGSGAISLYNATYHTGIPIIMISPSYGNHYNWRDNFYIVPPVRYVCKWTGLSLRGNLFAAPGTPSHHLQHSWLMVRLSLRNMDCWTTSIPKPMPANKNSQTCSLTGSQCSPQSNQKLPQKISTSQHWFHVRFQAPRLTWNLKLSFNFWLVFIMEPGIEF